MPTIDQFTSHNVRTLPEGEWREKASPLVLRVRRQTRSFVLEYSRGGKTRRYLLGHVGVLELGGPSGARELARKARARVTVGGDPYSERKEAARQKEIEARKAEVGSMRALCEAYLAVGEKRDGSPMDPAGVAKARRHLEMYVYPSFGHVKAEELSRREVREHPRQIAKTKPRAAGHVLATWRRALSWAEDEDLIESHPLLRVPPPAPASKRSRVLSDDELRWLWQAMDARATKREAENKRPSAIAHALRLSLLTGLRMGAVSLARWAELREEQPGEWWWTVPKARTKSRRDDHRVYLSLQARAIFELMRPATGGHEFVFATDSATGAIVNWPLVMARFVKDARRLARANGDGHAFEEKAVAHDLRRTAAKNISEMFEDTGAARFYVKLILGHADPSVTQVYDRNRHDRTRRKVLQAWNARVEQIVQGRAPATVIQFPAAAEA